MKSVTLAANLLAFFSLTSTAKDLVGTEEHASPEACRAAIRQYAKDMETWKKHDGQFIEVTWTGANSVRIEYSDFYETLTCKGNISSQTISSDK